MPGYPDTPRSEIARVDEFCPDTQIQGPRSMPRCCPSAQASLPPFMQMKSDSTLERKVIDLAARVATVESKVVTVESAVRANTKAAAAMVTTTTVVR